MRADECIETEFYLSVSQGFNQEIDRFFIRPSNHSSQFLIHPADTRHGGPAAKNQDTNVHRLYNKTSTTVVEQEKDLKPNYLLEVVYSKKRIHFHDLAYFLGGAGKMYSLEHGSRQLQGFTRINCDRSVCDA